MPALEGLQIVSVINVPPYQAHVVLDRHIATIASVEVVPEPICELLEGVGWVVLQFLPHEISLGGHSATSR